jgi:5'(3')-deoxyribonucleotidase
MPPSAFLFFSLFLMQDASSLCVSLTCSLGLVSVWKELHVLSDVLSWFSFCLERTPCSVHTMISACVAWLNCLFFFPFLMRNLLILCISKKLSSLES